MKYKLYTLDNQFIEETNSIPIIFTGIIENEYETKRWYLNGKLHRTDGPAIEYADGTKFWFFKGKRQRLDGPAVYHWNGTKKWWINDKQVSEEQHKLYVDLLKLKGLI